MRKILFRGKILGGEKWVEGWLKPFTNGGYDGKDDRLCIQNGSHSFDIYEVDPKTVGQYTGLNDRNGKRIFEGDIVDYEDEVPGQYEYHDGLFINRGVIKYSEGCFYWTNGVAADLVDCVYKGVADCVVIGNIHDNPELLDEKQ